MELASTIVSLKHPVLKKKEVFDNFLSEISSSLGKYKTPVKLRSEFIEEKALTKKIDYL